MFAPPIAPLTSSCIERVHEFPDPLARRPKQPSVKKFHTLVPKNACVVALATTIEVPISISDVNDFRRLGDFDFLRRGGILAR